MQDLRFIGVHEDGRFALLADEDGTRYRLPLDNRFRAAVTRVAAKATREAALPTLTAREVQSLIRAGVSAEDVAQRAGWALSKVGVFEAPVLAERGHVVGLAMNARLHPRGGGEPELLSTRVERRLIGRGVAADQTEWDATRPVDGDWHVHVLFTAGGRNREATWRFDHAAGVLEAQDDEARWLSEDEGAGGHVPTPPRFTGEVVYDVDAAGGVVAGDLGIDEPEHPRSGETDALLTALRETTHASGRRGPRRRGRAGGSTSAGSSAAGAAAAGASAAGTGSPSGTAHAVGSRGGVSSAEAGSAAVDIAGAPPAGSRGVPPAGSRGEDARGIPQLPLEDMADPEAPAQEQLEEVDAPIESGSIAEPQADDAQSTKPEPAQPQADEPQADEPEADEREVVEPEVVEDEPTATDDAEVESAGVEGAAADQELAPDAATSSPAPKPTLPPSKRRGRVGVPDWNDVMFGPSRGSSD